jgi:Uma2 family endonuclease
MVPIQFEERVRIPGISDLESFRRWARSDEFPEQGRFAFLRGEVWVDLSMEQAFTHNRVKTRISTILDGIVTAESRGYYFSDGMFLSNPEVDLSTTPDGVFVATSTLQSGQVRLLEGAEGGYVELVGAPDMVLEVVSAHSVRKDTEVLRRLYWEAEIAEYWLVDARGTSPRFDILRRGGRGYIATRAQQGGWLRSLVFERSFRFNQATDALGHPQYQLEVRG